MKYDSLIEVGLLVCLLVVYSLVFAALKYFGKYVGIWRDCFFILLVFLALIGGLTVIIAVIVSIK